MILPEPDAPPPTGLAACAKCEKPNHARASFCVFCGNPMEAAARLSPAGVATKAQPTPRTSTTQRPGPVRTQTTQPPVRPEPVRQTRGPDAAVGANDSGTRSAQPPQALRGFNWGAFLLGPIWGLGNAVLPAILIGAVGVVISYVTRSGNQWVSLAAAFFANVYIGIRANEWAWKARRWQSVEHFKRVQTGWLLWGVVLVVALTIMYSYWASTGDA